MLSVRCYTPPLKPRRTFNPLHGRLDLLDVPQNKLRTLPDHTRIIPIPSYPPNTIEAPRSELLVLIEV